VCLLLLEEGGGRTRCPVDGLGLSADQVDDAVPARGCVGSEALRSSHVVHQVLPVVLSLLLIVIAETRAERV
jgi:hypothetical protein